MSKIDDRLAEELSNCHKAKVRVVGETTNYYVCELCQEPCDLWQERFENGET